MDEQHPDGFKESELETLGSLERDLPVELSFLIRQQAYCMARMNYLDRQIKELKESKQSHPIPSCSRQSTYNQLQSNNINNNHHHQHHQNHNQRINTINHPNISTAIGSTNAIVLNKNGNFIPSDDSGGEYSRATISDDDELSSLLDQIAKSVKPDQRSNINQNMNTNLQHHQQLTQYSVISNHQPQPYAIINPNQLHHHQAVPVFVMGSPITTAHPSSISSTILPGVHFQPEPRYNQYYEDYYVQNNNNNNSSNNISSPLNVVNKHTGTGRSRQQFDSSITAIEQLVSQKEKRQVKSQLRCADNWLKMRSSGMCNLNDFGTSSGSSNSSNNNSATSNTERIGTNNSDGSVIERNLPKSTSSATISAENKHSNSVIDNRNKSG